MIDYDICMCATKDCPRYNICYRGGGFNRGAGIYTVSFFGDVCNESNGYPNFFEDNYGRNYKDDE